MTFLVRLFVSSVKGASGVLAVFAPIAGAAGGGAAEVGTASGGAAGVGTAEAGEAVCTLINGWGTGGR